MPDETVDRSDPGDDVLRRFRYQAGRAALLALLTLDDTSGVVEVFCEQHEDVLLRRVDGRFDAEQVKTRSDGGSPFKSGDEAVQTALKNFVGVDGKFPGRIRRFVLSTNIGFWTEEKNRSNLPYLLSQAAGCDGSGDLPKPLQPFVKALAAKCRSDEGPVVGCLKRVELDSSLPKFTDLVSRLAHRLGERPEYDRTLSDLRRAARALIELATRAGETTPDAVTDDYVAYADDPEAATNKATIEGKCLNLHRVRACIDEALASEAVLQTAEAVALADIPSDTGRSEQKMTRGRITSMSVTAMQDGRASFEWGMARRIQQGRASQADRDYRHLLALVRNEAAEARDLASIAGEPYGTAMLNDIRQRLREIARDEPATARNLNYQQLLGVATVLTERCDIWWSEEFELASEETG
jgi:hypothetical protein